MNLHEHSDEFNQLIILAAKHFNIPENAVKKDYYILMVLEKLAESEYASTCIFKGGTSLSKCYPGSIERFSEDIDLTFYPDEKLTEKQYDKKLKKIEAVLSEGIRMEKIPEERNSRNKSAYVWFDDEDYSTRIKLEIGSSVKPDPYEPRAMKSYIQEFLESTDQNGAAEEYGLRSIELNVLRIERTFIDKIMSVKRHAICGTLPQKVRHIYDVTALYRREDIQTFLVDSDMLKSILEKTKSTDSFYLKKRNIAREYNPIGMYDFESWKNKFDDEIKKRYETLHNDLLYSNEKQDFNEAIAVFEKLNKRFAEIEE